MVSAEIKQAIAMVRQANTDLPKYKPREIVLARGRDWKFKPPKNVKVKNKKRRGKGRTREIVIQI